MTYRHSVNIIDKDDGEKMRLVFQGIKDLDSNPQSWGVVTTIGQRSNKGIPTDTDKFFIKRPNAVPKKFGSRTGLVRENDPEFAQFNKSDAHSDSKSLTLPT